MFGQDGDAVTVVQDVLVVRRLDFGWHCEIAGEPVFLATLQVALDVLMPVPGKRGPIKLLAAVMDDVTALAPQAFRGIR
jgi:hypothetical protein